MNMLRKLITIRKNGLRWIETHMQPPAIKKIVVEPLVERELIRVHGEEVQQFLQGLITNDIFHLNKPQTSLYTMVLNKSGRVLYDAIVYREKEPNSYIIECDRNVTADLKRHLRLYRVRRKIDVENIDKEFSPWVVFNPTENNINPNASTGDDWFFTLDPRLKELGLRCLMPPSRTWIDLVKIFSSFTANGINVPTVDCNYKLHRFSYGVGEGITDLPPGKCFALESNGDFLHGVSFHKGCYIGQELTARQFHTGVVRKRLMPIRLTAKNAAKGLAVQMLNGANAGILRDSSQSRGLALMRVESALKNSEFMIDGEICYVERPSWWPKELRHKAILGN